jgi:hypothetical protein
MSEKRTIKFNPDFLNYSNNKTRKKREPGETSAGGEIKVKTPRPKKRDDTLRKRSILKMIRAHQQEKYNKMFDESEKKRETKLATQMDTGFNSEFEESKKYLDRLMEENKNKERIHNSTLKQYSSVPNSVLYNNSTFDSILSSAQPSIVHSINNEKLETSSIKVPEIPKYGCLKNGSLPTYRSWLNKTQRNSTPYNTPPPQTFVRNTIEHAIPVAEPNLVQEAPIRANENLLRSSAVAQTMAKLHTIQNNERMMNKKQRQKRTIRRTYKIGKSKVLPKISVLVSNRTIRNNISTKSQLLKQVPIQDVKKFLIKRGFIKVGSTAPNDVLRKMYETASLICGDVQNHNPENLLYNFVNDDDK